MGGRRVRVVEVELSTNCHATEEPEKVATALRNLLPPQLRSGASIEEQVLTGYYGNPIRRMRIRVRGRDAEEVLRHILRSMDDTDREVLFSTLESRFDPRGSRLYLRVGKQDAYLGRIRLYDGSDAVRVVASFAHARNRVDDVRSFLKSLLGEGS